MAHVFDAGVAVREERGDEAAHELLERVAAAEAEGYEVVAVGRAGEWVGVGGG